MEKLFVFFVTALFTNGAIGQGQAQQIPGQNQFPTAIPNIAPTPARTPAPTTAPTSGTTTMSPEVRQCINTCPVTSEYNPVCGNDGITYPNPGRLFCAQQCGVGVSLLRTSPCPTPAPVDPA